MIKFISNIGKSIAININPMASTITTEKLSTTLKVEQFDLDPGATTLTDVSFVDMRDFENFFCSFTRTVGTSVIVFNLIANPESDGSGTDVIIKTSTFAAGQPNLVGDNIFLEMTAEEIVGLGTALRYVSANISFATGTDEAVVTYIRGGARYPQEALSVETVA